MGWFVHGEQATTEFQEYAEHSCAKHVVLTNLPIALVSFMAIQKKAPLVAVGHLAGAAASTIYHLDETNVKKYLWDQYMGLGGVATHVVHAFQTPRQKSFGWTIASAAMTAALYHRSSQLWYKKKHHTAKYNMVHSMFHTAMALTGAVHLATY